jgi:phage integrase
MKCEIITGNMPQLWEELLLQLQEQKYPSKSIRHYREAMGRVDRYMRENKISEYTEAVGDAYLATHDERTSNGRSFYMSFHVKRLNDILNKQPYIMVHTKASQKELRYFNDVFDGFSEMLRKQPISESTRKLQKLYCYEFLHFIEQQGISDPKEINAQIIYAAFSASGSKENFGCAARKLLKYLYQEQLHPVDLTEFVPSVRRAKPMPTVYSKDEIEKLLNVVDKCTAKGLRDYVMLLLAARLGIRVSDICNLKLDDVHWDTNTIEFTQIKTGVFAKLELLPEIRAALFAYLTMGRPDSDSANIFLRAQCPFTPIGRSTVHHIMTRYLAKAGIYTGDRKTGPHALRMSLATELVAEDVPYSVVHKILGHQSSLCFNNYVRLDIENLRRCAIAVPPATGKLKEWLDNMGRDFNEK